MPAALEPPNISSAGDDRAPLKTAGQIEAIICDAMVRFEQTYLGRGPKDIRAHLVGDLLVVRMQGVLTDAERHLGTTLPPERGRELLKQVRTSLIEVARQDLQSLVYDITGVKVRSLHHDISTRTGEEVVIFTLAETPQFRETQRTAFPRGPRRSP